MATSLTENVGWPPPGCKQVRVENWGTFFLQKLQTLYEKGCSCDTILQFHDGGEIKVHKIVLTTCTDYFNGLTATPDNKLVLPPILKYDFLLPVVNFLYTGRLDYRVENLSSLLYTCELLNLDIVITLIKNAQGTSTEGKSSGAATPSSSVSVSSPVSKKASSSNDTSSCSSTPHITASPVLPGKKLPFWKKRTTFSQSTDDSYQTEPVKWTRVMQREDPRPTRFEWPEENDSKPPIIFMTPSFNHISYDSEMIVKSTDMKRALEDDEVSAIPSDETVSTVNQLSKSSSSSAPNKVVSKAPFKRLKSGDNNCFGLESDDDDDDDDSQFPSVHNCDDDDDDEDDDDEDDCVDDDEGARNESAATTGVDLDASGVFSRSSPVATKSSSGVTVDYATARTAATPASLAIAPVFPSPKPILKPLTTDTTSSPSLSKKVRFSLASEGKENVTKTSENKITPSVSEVNASVSTKNKVVSTNSLNKSESSGNSNYTKIVSEVLKKYPDLVKNNKNITLKIMLPNQTPGSTPAASPVAVKSTKLAVGGKSVVSYKYKIKPDGVASNGQSGSQQSSQPQSNSVTVPSPLSKGAENMTGPWQCVPCGTNDEPLNFESYYVYRRHLQDVHMERIDARICEHCGFKSSKRNLHLYHLYTKHNIQPPRNINFPKCDQCEYIALSDSLLIKHRNNHVGTNKDFVCKVCNATFKSHGALQGHMQTSLHHISIPSKEYTCDFCDKVFNRNINLKAHIRTVHKDDSRKLYDEEESTMLKQNLLQVIQVPVLDNLHNDLKGQQTLLLPPGMTILAENPGVPGLLQSSESEALNNVATGIATSLNLNQANLMSDQAAVIFLDNNETTTMLFDQSGHPVAITEAGMLTSDATTGDVQEYIIPEIIATGSSIGQVFTTQAQPTIITTTAGDVVVPVSICSHIPAPAPPALMDTDGTNTSTDHTYADDALPQNGEATDTPMEHEPIQAEIDSRLIPTSAIPQDIQIVVNAEEEMVQNVAGVVEEPESSEDIPSGDMCSASDEAMEVCERDSIIIEPSAKVHSNVNTVSSEGRSQDDGDSPAETADSGYRDCVQAISSVNTVIVSAAAPSALSSVKKQPKEELVEDWEDFDEDENATTAQAQGFSLTRAMDVQTAEDIRPSRPTIELDESILPDM